MPLTSNPKKLSVTIQCVVRTVAECRRASGMSDPRAANTRKSADSAMANAADDSTRLGRRQWDCQRESSNAAALRAARSPRSAERRPAMLLTAQGGAGLSFSFIHPCRNERYPIGNLPGKRYGHRSAERYTLDL